MTSPIDILGTGHPNKILQVDYAGPDRRRWFVRVETLVPIENGMLEQVKTWLDSSDPDDRKQLADYLVNRVPDRIGPEGQDEAKHMIFAAFGLERPAGGGPQETRRQIAD